MTLAQRPTDSTDEAPPRPSARGPWPPKLGARRVPRALGVQRFVGGAQLLGGLTLTLGYSPGTADALDLAGARSALVWLGITQIAVGATLVAFPTSLRHAGVRAPGRVAASALLVASAVIALGGSSPDTLYVTSAMSWLVLAGYVLPGRRWLLGGTVVTAAGLGTWMVVDGADGGFTANGAYWTVGLYLASIVFAGLWLGRAAGRAARTVARWHVIELHEHGQIARLRAAVAVVDERGRRLVEGLPRDEVPAELAALREQTRALTAAEQQSGKIHLSALLDGIEREIRGVAPDLVVELDLGGHGELLLRDSAAAALGGAIRRQWTNVIRHAAAARCVRITVRRVQGELVVRVEDDGAGALPFRPGSGSAWSTRQLARVGGRPPRYYAAAGGVGLEIAMPIDRAASLGDDPDLSVGRSLDRLIVGMLDALRWAGYVGDTFTAMPVYDDGRWLLIPAFAVLIEAVLYLRVLRLAPTTRLVIAAALSVVLTAAFAIPAGSDPALAPATTSVVVAALLIAAGQWRWWLLIEALRMLAVAPLLARHGVDAVPLGVTYPVLFAALIIAVYRYAQRARGLEASVADAVGRAGLAATAVRSLAMRHDIADVVRRTAPDDAELEAELEALEDALAASAARLAARSTR